MMPAHGNTVRGDAASALFLELHVCCCHGAMIFTRTIQPVVDGVEIQQHLLLHGVVE